MGRGERRAQRMKEERIDRSPLHADRSLQCVDVAFLNYLLLPLTAWVCSVPCYSCIATVRLKNPAPSYIVQ